MRVGITDTLNDKIKFYEDWVGKVDASINIVKLSYELENLHDLDACDGLILTGGCDIHPKLYGQQDPGGLVERTDEKRDEFELATVKRARENSLPVFGICRGMQVFNVERSGTMILDIGDGIHRGKETKEDIRHPIRIVSGTVLHSIAGASEGVVNSRHHQAVGKIGDGLRITAKSMDGFVEGLEWENPNGQPFLLLVQWHPERMTDCESPLSKGLLERFIGEVQASKNAKTSSLHN